MKYTQNNRVVIISAGFGGLWVAKTLFNNQYEVIVIDKNTYHIFLPLLYEIVLLKFLPNRLHHLYAVLRKNANIHFIRGEVRQIKSPKKVVVCLGQEISFDYCVISTGSVNHYFNTPGAFEYAFPLKTLYDAMVLRNHILTCFERASFIDNHIQRQRLLTIVIVGGGPTGVEFSGALAVLIAGPLNKDFPNLNNQSIAVYLVEVSNKLVGMFEQTLSKYTHDQLQKKGVSVKLNATVAKIDPKGICLKDSTIIPTETVVWTACVKGQLVKTDLKVENAPNGRILVDKYCRIPGYDNVFIIGDLACFMQNGNPLPMIATVAIQQERYVGNYLKRLAKGKIIKPFAYLDRGSMVAIGRNKAISKIAGLRVK